MPNPASLDTGNPGSVSATAVAGSISLSSEHAWDIVHTGFNAAGVAAEAPVWLRVNDTPATAAVADKTILLPPGMTYTLPKGTRTLAFLAGAGSEPVLTLLSSREGVK